MALPIDKNDKLLLLIDFISFNFNLFAVQITITLIFYLMY